MICIDESGSLGNGANRYFVITAVEIDNPHRLKNIVKRFNRKYSLDELKGSSLTVPQRQELLNNLNRFDDYRATYLVLDKNNFHRKDILGKNILFNYLSSFVCENILKNTAEDIVLSFDNRTVRTTAKHSLPEYLQIKCLEWNVGVNLDVQFYESHRHRGIQIADLISNTIFQSYKNGKKHFYNQLKIKKSIRFPYQQFGL